MAADKKGVDQDLTEFGASAAGGSFAFVIASIMKAVLMLFLLVALGRLLEPSGYGLYSIVIAFYSIIETGSYFGLGNAIRQRLPAAKDTDAKIRVIANGFFVSITIGIILMVVLILLSKFIALNLYDNSTLIAPIQISALAILFSLTYYAATSALLGLLRNKEAGIGMISFSLTQLLASVGLVLLGYGVSGAVAGLLIGYILASIVSVAFLLRSIKFRIVRPTKAIMIDLVKFSIPVFISNTTTTLSVNFGIAFLGLFVSAAIVGNYSAAYRVGSFSDTILIATTTVLLATFSQLFSDKNLSKDVGIAYNGSLYYTLIFLLPLVAYMISVAVPFMAVLFGYSFSSAPLYFALVSGGITLGIIGRYAGTMILGYGDARKFMVYQIIATAIQILLIIALVPYFGAMGLIVALYILGTLVLDAVYLKALF